MKNFYSKSKNCIGLLIDGKSYTLTHSHPNFDTIDDLLNAEHIDWEAIALHLDIQKAVLEYTGSNIKVVNGEFFYKAQGKKMIQLAENAIVTRIIDLFKQGQEFAPLLNFLDNVSENPSNTAIQELFLFLEDNSLPITPDGHFLAYKRITGDYKDCHTKTIDNRLGMTVTMPRAKVDDDRYRTCSNGLHFCAKGYLQYYPGEKVVVVKVNPADVVSIPADYDNMKGRCCRYKVIAEIADEKSDDMDLCRYINDDPESPIIMTVEKEIEPIEEKEEEMVTYIGSVKGFLKDFPKEARKVGRTYRLKTALGTSEYEFVKTTGDRAFTKIRTIDEAAEAKKVGGKKDVSNQEKKAVENTKSTEMKTEAAEPKKETKKAGDKKPTKKAAKDNAVKEVKFKGTVLEFKRKYPKEKRKFGVVYVIENSAGSSKYEFKGTLGERGLTKVN